MRNFILGFLLLGLLSLSGCKLKNNGEPYPGSRGDTGNMSQDGDIDVPSPVGAVGFDENVICFNDNESLQVYLRVKPDGLKLAAYDTAAGKVGTTLFDSLVSQSHTQSYRRYLSSVAQLSILKNLTGVTYEGTLDYLDANQDWQRVSVNCESTGYSKD